MSASPASSASRSARSAARRTDSSRSCRFLRNCLNLCVWSPSAASRERLREREDDDDVETSPRRRRGSVDALTRDASTNARRSARRRPNIVAVDPRRPRHNEVDDDDARVVAGVNIVVDDERVVGTKTRR